MSQNLNPNKWCEPLHRQPEGEIDPSNITLPTPFVIAVLGGSRGIGGGVATSFVKAGASAVIILGRTQSALDSKKSELEGLGKKTIIHTIACDVTQDDSLAKAADEIKRTFDRLDVLVINAGRGSKLVKQPNGLRDWPNNFIDADMADFRSVMDLNTLAPYVAAHHFLPLLEASKDGPQTLAIISSVAMVYMNPSMMSAAYSLSKFAATRIVEHVHEAHKGKGVCAFAIQPGGVTSTMSDQIPEGKGWEKRKCLIPIRFIKC
jgi:NAD(P)-dependent dehydrogenase (short-subunit alcohol dehydrogenase family)